jgi:putative radical SAM enzyme (TIGR03279 family)
MPIVKCLHHHRVISPGVLSSGDEIVAINGHVLRDVIDARFYAAEEKVELSVRRFDGREMTVALTKGIDAELGIEYEPDKIRVCQANCDFCFVRQQPKKILRRALCIKDDDYRLSFLHGNFVTLTNMTEEDYARVFEQHLSPLYVSVHSTDDNVRRIFLRKPDAEPIVPLLKRLHDHGIRTHTQIVVTPGINDGAALWRSFDDLVALYPNVLSVGVVPVGLTRHRDDLPKLSLVAPEMAGEILDEIERRHKRMRRRHQLGAIYAADEMYLIAGRPIPAAVYYDDYCQLENGIGMLRRLLDGYAVREKEIPRRLARPLRLCFVTGASAGPFIADLCERVSRKVKNLEVMPLVVNNDFWGDTVTVSGLLTGADIAAQFTQAALDVDAVVLPPDCLNTDELFLDDETVPGLQEQLGLPLLHSEYDFVASVLQSIAAVRSAQSAPSEV